jgi:DnaJ homologue, subfamily C, member 28, conserved domain
VRREADGGIRLGPTWESVTERMIREAHEAGDFDDLPGRGRRLDIDDDPREGEMGLAFHILRTNDAVPPWIAADRETRRCAEVVEQVLEDAAHAARSGRIPRARRDGFRRRMSRALAAHAHAVDAVNATAPSTTLHRRAYDAADVHARLERALDGRPPDPGTA